MRSGRDTVQKGVESYKLKYRHMLSMVGGGGTRINRNINHNLYVNIYTTLKGEFSNIIN